MMVSNMTYPIDIIGFIHCSQDRYLDLGLSFPGDNIGVTCTVHRECCGGVFLGVSYLVVRNRYRERFHSQKDDSFMNGV